MEQAATGVVVVFVSFEVLGEVLDAGGEQADLDTGGAGVVVVIAEFLHYFRIGGRGQVLFPNDKRRARAGPQGSPTAAMERAARQISAGEYTIPELWYGDSISVNGR